MKRSDVWANSGGLQTRKDQYLPHQTHSGGGRVDYQGDCGTPTVELTTVKLLLNSIVPTLNSKFMTTYIKDLYLHTSMAQSEYMRLKLSDLPNSVVQYYNLAKKATRDGYVYVDIR